MAAVGILPFADAGTSEQISRDHGSYYGEVYRTGGYSPLLMRSGPRQATGDTP